MDRLEEIETYYKDMPDQSMVKWLIAEVRRLRAEVRGLNRAIKKRDEEALLESPRYQE